MLRVEDESSDGRRNSERGERCLICDNRWGVKKKLIDLLRWPSRCAPRTWISRAVILLSLFNVAVANYASDIGTDVDGDGHFTRQWAVHIEGGQEVASRIAAKHGFINLGKIFQDFYHFEHRHLAKRSLTPHSDYHKNLTNEAEVKWALQQVIKRRSKRDLISPRPKTKSSTRLKSNSVRFNDVEWPQMWYLNRGQGLDMNVEGAWREGISGSGVVVTILDDGLEKNHPDLMANYDPQASYDVNSHDEDPMPRYDPLDSNRHGTRCAGEVAAVANNSLCSVGVAFGASVGGVRMLDGDVTDAVEARSLSLNPQHIDIYSASWGPDDDGKTVDGPGELATRAFVEGVTKGRQGKGSIFVWASGNGGREHDNCNCDGYTNSIWTLSISSATENGFVPWYSEACSSTLATTYSSGSLNEKQIVTTDLRNKCTNGHTGTSASAPLAAGICALALEANKDLTWRDMQHIVVRTAKPANLKSSDWKVNGVGRNVSHSFGYGLMDATAMVRLARSWKTVPEQHRCEVLAPHRDKSIPPRSKVILDLNVTECSGVNFLEHVQAKISLSSHQRGDIQIYLTSPAGTKSTLLARRPKDTSKNPFNSWPFMSVHTWGEMPFGIWQLEIHNGGGFLGKLESWQMLFYGTEVPPNNEEGHLSAGKNGGHLGITGNNNGVKNGLRTGNVNLGDDVSNHLDTDTTGNRIWKDQATRRDDVTRTTMDPIGGSHSGCISSLKPNVQCIECIPQLYLYGGRCEAICPPKTYPGINAKKKAACLPCHYTCLTCVGESDGHCTSCHGESTPVPSGLTDTGSSNFDNSDVDSQDDVKMEDLSLVDPEVHLSWGKRSESSRKRQVHEEYGNKSMLTKKAVTKKILEPYNSPRPLFYCYPTRVFDQIKASDSWYRRMTVIFAVNLVFLIAILIFLLWRGYCSRRRGKYHGDAVIWRYLKNDKSAAHRPNDDNIIYLPSSSDEDDLGINK